MRDDDAGLKPFDGIFNGFTPDAVAHPINGWLPVGLEYKAGYLSDELEHLAAAVLTVCSGDGDSFPGVRPLDGNEGLESYIGQFSFIFENGVKP